MILQQLVTWNFDLCVYVQLEKLYNNIYRTKFILVF